MKTIEERAEEYSVKNWIATNPFVACKDGYIRGATEQKQIDDQQLCEMVLDNQNAIIEKACEAFKTICKEHAGLCDREWLCYGCNKYERFRKAMEGE